MLIHDFVQVRAPLAIVRELLDGPTPQWLTDGASAAYGDGERLLQTLAGTEGRLTLGKRVHVELDAPYSRGQGVVLPLSWWATGAQYLFPTLEADLEVMPMGSDEVMLTLMGRYEPPLGAVGQRLGRLALHRVAEASVRSFLRRAAVHLEQRVLV